MVFCLAWKSKAPYCSEGITWCFYLCVQSCFRVTSHGIRFLSLVKAVLRVYMA